MNGLLRLSAVLATASVLSGCATLGPIVSPTPSGSVIANSTATPTPSGTPEEVAELAWDELTEKMGPSVLAISPISCSGSVLGSGTAFVVGEDLLMTAAHVVDSGDSYWVARPDGTVVIADLLGFDHSSDSAVLRSREKLGTPAFELLAQEPRQASELLVMGYPYFTTELFTSEGILGGHAGEIDYGYFTVEGVIVTSAATNPGNSGGPAVDRQGAVIGLVSGGAVWLDIGPDTKIPVEGVNYLVPSPRLVENLKAWSGLEPRPSTCEEETQGEDGPPEPTVPDWVDVATDSLYATEIASALGAHGEGINTGDYYSAWVGFTASMQERMGSLEGWSSGLTTSTWDKLTILSVESDAEVATVHAILQTSQDPSASPEGQTCSIHDMTYTMISTELEGYLIDRASRPEAPISCG